MCVEIRRKYQHCECSTYLDTHICNAALGLDEYDDNVLSETKFLPDKPRKIPNGCSLKIATSPSAASCPRCEREKRMAGTTTNATAAAATAQPARTTPVPAAALQDPRLNESPGPQAAERVRNSLILLEKQRKSSGESVK